ncbi:hypothetical protein L484_019964 [Morus notabilis]|uniref:Uncharacterized protein n=1 Tax=Morus notabilis TaxID=981085 RepID=W9R564_9ROSA|nr:hypothetical protein L484_019964 [Morus notabilis]
MTLHSEAEERKRERKSTPPFSYASPSSSMAVSFFLYFANLVLSSPVPAALSRRAWRTRARDPILEISDGLWSSTLMMNREWEREEKKGVSLKAYLSLNIKKDAKSHVRIR